ncbi:PAS domain-containing protein [Hymenobacter sp. BT559]|uniref:PAS domain-containing protein n=1 Tax=Hymenobacter sp. BT559 TaxID=2795729 RepID=UPI0018EB9D0C|nr:PAS domain-containing protein [Hymenobacter sp. BT559]MBJ6142207.1 PAS domain-containing protein [Hymenobacter sp. BT559]
MQDYSLLSPLIERGNTVYFVCDLPQRRVVQVSNSYQQVLGSSGIDPTADLSQWVSRLHPDDWQYLCREFATVQPGDLLSDKEVRITWADGSTHWLSVQADWVFGPGGLPYLSGQVQDVTATKKVALNAQKFSTKKDATFEILSHDLAAPLVNAWQLSLVLKDILGGQASAKV